MTARPDAGQLCLNWPFLGPPETLTLTPMTGGTNNTLYRVTSVVPGAPAYALRLAAPHHDERHMRLEYSVLTALERQGLPFAVPTPILTADGAPWASLALANHPTRTSLTRQIRGVRPAPSDLALTVSCGEAIGALDGALASVTLDEQEAAISWRSAGALDRISPFVPDPLTAFETLDISAGERERLRAGYEYVAGALPALYTALPQHLVHEDPDPGNVLTEDGRVTGVLDFEFLARDLRVADLTIALVWWPESVRESGGEWPVIAALARGYARSLHLTAPEIDAIPTLYRMRGYTSLIHRMGRALQGVSPMEHTVARARAALRWQDWLDANGARLVETVARAMEAG